MSLDANALLQHVKQAAVDAVQAGKPMGRLSGTVESLAPLRIRVDQKLTLSSAQLLLSSSVRDFTVDMTMDHQTESISHSHTVRDTYSGGGTAAPMDHAHPYAGRKSFTVHLGLRVGEHVILLRCDGGQQFIVLDRWEALP